MRFILLLVLAIFTVCGSAVAQISSGGFPLEVVGLKSAAVPVVKMPAFKLSTVETQANRLSPGAARLKPFTFAHAFEVDFSPSGSGQWYSTASGINVWKLKIASAGAKSLNLIFDRFSLPENTRLFIYNEKANHYLGAFTSQNNKPGGKFAVSPVAGDEITVQYEVPATMGTPDHFTIIRVNHDYVGILKSERRPLGIEAGECNLDVNCEIGGEWTQVKNSVCRLIVNGKEICSGTLVNNTAEDRKPYILSASHCYDKWEYAQTTVYTFNYESPYCAPLDGDPSHSISGAIMKAQYDSLDFALAEMTVVPPPSFRPYYAGWDRSANLPDSSVSIHHPQGDIKKISFDHDPPVHSDFNTHYTKNGFIKVLRWDEGVTEVGSSGGPLYNTDNNVIGTLTGGAARCGDPVNDFYARLDMYWSYRTDSSKQLKYWLDPLKTGAMSLNGKFFYEDEDRCKAFTNLIDDDEHDNIVLTDAGARAGYWGGTNSVGITEIVERFSIPGNEILDGVSLGVGKLVAGARGMNSEITVKVYDGEKYPETLIYSKVVNINDFAEDAMNYIGFDKLVDPIDTFFVGFELSNLHASDTFAVYQSLRQDAGAENNFYFEKDGQWHSFKESNQEGYAMVNVMELVACNYDELINDTPAIDTPVNVWIFPNPASSELNVESDREISPGSVSVYNMIGQEVDVELVRTQKYKVRIDLAGITPGVYFVRFKYDRSFVTRKFSYVPR